MTLHEVLKSKGRIDPHRVKGHLLSNLELIDSLIKEQIETVKMTPDTSKIFSDLVGKTHVIKNALVHYLNSRDWIANANINFRLHPAIEPVQRAPLENSSPIPQCKI